MPCVIKLAELYTDSGINTILPYDSEQSRLRLFAAEEAEEFADEEHD